MSPRSLLSSSLAAVLLAGCAAITPSSTRVRVGGDDAGTPRLGPSTSSDPTLAPATNGGTSDMPSTLGRPTTAATRRVCRSTAFPSGWIAISYEASASGECPTGNKNTNDHQIAVLVRYTNEPLNAILDVCADQRIPSAWVSQPDANVDTGVCPGAGPNGGSAMTRIRRAR